MRDLDDLPLMPAGYEVPEFVKSLLENFDVSLFQLRIDPNPDEHINLIRNLYVHDLLVAAMVVLNMPREKEVLVKELSLQIEILDAVTNPISEDLKN